MSPWACSGGEEIGDEMTGEGLICGVMTGSLVNIGLPSSRSWGDSAAGDVEATGGTWETKIIIIALNLNPKLILK